MDATFTRPLSASDGESIEGSHRASLDDFEAKASFAALNSLAPAAVRRGVDRTFVETMVPLKVRNAGPGFAHYSAPGVKDSGDGIERS